MNPAQLLAHFEKIAGAPDAIPRLRCFIRELAVRGKLVLQDPKDDPVAATLRRIKVSGNAAGAFDVPPTWLWVNVGAVADTRLGKMLDQAKNRGTPRPYLRNVSVRWFGFDLSDLMEMPFEDNELKEFALQPGDVLICEGGEPGRAAVWRSEGADIYFQKAIHRARFKDFVNPDYFVNAIRASADDGRLAGSFTGTGIKHFTGKGLDAYRFPLPPFDEQCRIVARVDELMTLCDQLEAARAGRESRRDRLAASSLARLNTPSADSFQQDARFALDVLPALTTRPDQIKQLRQTILNLAVRGKLVPQDPNDELIHVRLKKASARRAALVSAKQVRQKKLDGYGDLVASEELPASWAVERLGNLVDPENTISYGVLVPGEDVADGIPFVRAQDLTLSDHPLRPNKTISPEIEKAYSRTRLRGGEILVCVVGSIGKLGVVPPSWAGANIARAVARIAPIPEISQEYLLVVIRGEPVQRYFTETTRTLAQPTLNVGLIEQTPIPLPPLAEQQRIVAKVDELMGFCDRLEASLTAIDERRLSLLKAILGEALQPAKVRDEAA